MVKFVSIDKTARTATFDVGGKPVTRRIPKQFGPAMVEEIVDGEKTLVRARPELSTLDDILVALAQGLELEFAAPADPTPLDESSFKPGDKLVP